MKFCCCVVELVCWCFPVMFEVVVDTKLAVVLMVCVLSVVYR